MVWLIPIPNDALFVKVKDAYKVTVKQCATQTQPNQMMCKNNLMTHYILVFLGIMIHPIGGNVVLVIP